MYTDKYNIHYNKIAFVSCAVPGNGDMCITFDEGATLVIANSDAEKYRDFVETYAAFLMVEMNRGKLTLNTKLGREIEQQKKILEKNAFDPLEFIARTLKL